MKLVRNIALVVCVIGMVGFATEVLVRKRLDLVSVVVLDKDLGPREVIEAADVKVKKVSSHFVGSDNIKNVDDVIGFYVKHQHTLYKGQVLLKSSVEHIDDALDGAALLLYENERVYAIKRDVVGSLGASLQQGSMIDVAIQDKKNDAYGIVVADVRVIGIKDRNGKEIENGGVPHVILLALHKDDVYTVLKAESDGNLVLLAKGFKDEG